MIKIFQQSYEDDKNASHEYSANPCRNCLCRILEALIFKFFYMLFSDKTSNKKAGFEQTNVHELRFMHYAVQVNFTVLISILSLRKIFLKTI
jgi:hypothetical protein